MTQDEFDDVMHRLLDVTEHMENGDARQEWDRLVQVHDEMDTVLKQKQTENGTHM